MCFYHNGEIKMIILLNDSKEVMVAYRRVYHVRQILTHSMTLNDVVMSYDVDRSIEVFIYVNAIGIRHREAKATQICIYR